MTDINYYELASILPGETSQPKLITREGNGVKIVDFDYIKKRISSEELKNIERPILNYEKNLLLLEEAGKILNEELSKKDFALVDTKLGLTSDQNTNYKLILGSKEHFLLLDCGFNIRPAIFPKYPDGVTADAYTYGKLIDKYGNDIKDINERVYKDEDCYDYDGNLTLNCLEIGSELILEAQLEQKAKDIAKSIIYGYIKGILENDSTYWKPQIFTHEKDIQIEKLFPIKQEKIQKLEKILLVRKRTEKILERIRQK
ncbi:hypothetical protein J4230_04450 [Candidatus Woesearchaeota archaeon]|nr:hypothetical protein [Candidatus Woesearchaeota archaeon]